MRSGKFRTLDRERITRKFTIFIVIFSIIVSVFFITVIAWENTSEMRVFKNEYPDGLHIIPVEDYGYAPILKNLIDNATTSILISTLELSDYQPVKTILDALINAHNRGVNVRVVYEGEISSNRYGAEYLRDHGIAVKNDSSPTFLHTKLVIIDSQVVYIGSHNWSPSAFEKNNEYGVFIFNQSIAEFYTRYFNSIWNNTDITPSIGELVESNKNLTVTCTYDGYTYKSLKNLLNSASWRLYVAVYTMRYYSNPSYNEEKINNLVNEIVSKKSIAKVVLDNHDSSYAYNYLKNNDVDVSKDSSSVITHLKLVIADNSVYVGDANWGAEYIDNSTHTVGVIIQNATIANFFADYFKIIKKYGDVPYYIPDAFVKKWYYSVVAGEKCKVNIYLANGGFKNQTTFYIVPSGDLNVSLNENPFWNRVNVYDWYNETMLVNTTSSPGEHIISLTFYSQDYKIKYTIYLIIYIENSIPENINLMYITIILGVALILFDRKWRKY